MNEKRFDVIAANTNSFEVSPLSVVGKCGTKCLYTCMISGSYSGGYEGFFLLGYKAVWPVESQPTFLRS
jgi:hypothetical protein